MTRERSPCPGRLRSPLSGWLEVALTVNGELAEAVADVLARFAPNGVAIESSAIRFVDDEDEGTPVGDVIVRAYLPADARLEEARRKLEESLYYLGMIQPLPIPTFTPIDDRNWMEAWKEHYHPIPIGRRLIIVPAWLDSPEPGRIPIKIDPGMAFGTGTHPTTQMSLDLLERCFVDDGPSSMVHGPSSVIDVGCGSGILSIAALKLGAARALGVDIDPASMENARANALANGIGEALTLGLGSVEEVRLGRFDLTHAPLVLANILAPVIVRLFEAGLGELISPGGTIILSGILQEQTESVLAAARAHGLTLVEQRQMGDWVAVAFHNPSPS